MNLDEARAALRAEGLDPWAIGEVGHPDGSLPEGLLIEPTDDGAVVWWYERGNRSNPANFPSLDAAYEHCLARVRSWAQPPRKHRWRSVKASTRRALRRLGLSSTPGQPTPERWLLLDVDGVLAPSGPGHRDDVFANFPFDPVTVPSHMPATLKAATNAGVRLAWCTMRTDEANTHLAPVLGLPTLHVIHPHGHGTPIDTKAATVPTWTNRLPAGSRFAWADDEFTPTVHALLGDRVHLIPVDPTMGLTPAHVQDAINYLTAP